MGEKLRMTNKKILVVTTTDNMIWQFLIPHIQHLQSLGNTVECVCAKTGFWFDELATKYNFVMHEINFTRNPISLRNLKGFNSLCKLQKENNYNLIYCQQPVGGVMGRKLGKKFKLPVIYTAHGFHFFKGNNPLKNVIFKTIEKHYAKYTTALITINEEDFQACQNWKAKQKFKINGIGVDLTKYKVPENFDKKKFREEIGFNENDFIVTSIGELNKNKNTLMLLEVFKNIKNENIKYLICGQGPLKKEYEKYIAENNLQNRVKMVGFRKDIPNILSATDLYIMPSFREGLSKSMMEAMCFGLPVVASKIRGNIDLLGTEEGGLLCNPKNNEKFNFAIENLFNSPKLCRQFGERNTEFVKNFDINVVLKQMEKIYMRI